MKNLRIMGGIVLCLISFNLAAQVKAPLNDPISDKPSLFSALPEKFTISSIAIEKIFTGASLGFVKIPIDGNKYFEGELVEKKRSGDELTTVNIRLPYYNNALFTISKITVNNTAPAYTGRIIHINYGDVLMLKTEATGLYLVKEKQSLFLVE